ncbi:MAG: Lytic transglycosylase catalytic [Solirubrobacterales bacterium]|nr:Lytic transglycosylase catalytic [Solirubrobacterales bacterium]
MSPTSGSSVAAGDQRAGTRLIAFAAAAAALAFMLATALAVLGGASLGAPDTPSAEVQDEAVSALATTEIPTVYLRLYQLAARRYGLSWAILAGIGKVECDHGRDPDPSCTHEGVVNSAGAGGPMQFIASTWTRYGVDAEGDGAPDRWNAADAIYAAANLLRASGAPESYPRAIFAYNHASWYVAEVESWAGKYSAAPTVSGASSSREPVAGPEAAEGERPEGADTALVGESPTPVLFVPGQRAELAPGDGHLALVPAGVPATVQAMVVAGNELQDLPYGPGGHPDPLGASEEDCSSSVNYVLYRSGVRPLGEIVRANPLAQDYVNWGAPGPGRWVTIYATDSPTPHVFIVVAGLRLDTSHDGTDVGPNRFEGGPRWRILDQIPTWARWSVRHPPGL